MKVRIETLEEKKKWIIIYKSSKIEKRGLFQGKSEEKKKNEDYGYARVRN